MVRNPDGIHAFIGLYMYSEVKEINISQIKLTDSVDLVQLEMW